MPSSTSTLVPHDFHIVPVFYWLCDDDIGTNSMSARGKHYYHVCQIMLQESPEGTEPESIGTFCRYHHPIFNSQSSLGADEKLDENVNEENESIIADAKYVVNAEF